MSQLLYISGPVQLNKGHICRQVNLIYFVWVLLMQLKSANTNVINYSNP